MKTLRSSMILLALLASLRSDPTLAEEVVFRPDPASSEIEVDVKATVGSFVGTVERFESEFTFEREEGSPGSGSLRFDFVDLETHEEKRNAHMMRWLDYPKHPSCTFTLETLSGTGAQRRAIGSLEAAGVKRPIEIPVLVSFEGDRAVVEGKTKVDYRDWGLKVIRMMLVLTVDPEFEIRFRLEGPVAVGG